MIHRKKSGVVMAAFMLSGLASVLGGFGATTQPAPPPTVEVGIDNFTFSPAELHVVAGTRVTWTNHDDVPHTATSSDSPRLFNSKALDTDQKYSFVFEKPGTYAYFCQVHPHMTGKIIVKAD